MLSIKPQPIALDSPRRWGPKRTRTLQRRLHLLTGIVLVVYIYATPAPNSAGATGVRWLVLPALVGSGVLMWQWPRLRRLLRRRTTVA